MRSEIPNSWTRLNDLVMGLGETETAELLNSERKGKRRKQWLLRIHSRLNKLRADRERAELRRIANGS